MRRAFRQFLPLAVALVAGVMSALAIPALCAWSGPATTIYFLNEHTGMGDDDYRRLARSIPNSERVVVYASVGFGHRSLDIRYYNAVDLSVSMYPPEIRRAFDTQLGWPNGLIRTNSRSLGSSFGFGLGPNSPTDDAVLHDGQQTTWRIL